MHVDTHIRPTTLDELASILGITRPQLLKYAYVKDTHLKDAWYTEFEILKRNGNLRKICAPIPELKYIQRKILDYLTTVYTPPEYVNGYVQGKSNVNNSITHVRSQELVKIDLKDFFNQIHFGRVYGVLQANPFNFNNAVATAIANVCTYRRILPQGAPTSPILTNMVFWKCDKEIEFFSHQNRLKYTRYADDITISSRNSLLPKSVIITDIGTYKLGEPLSVIFTKNDFTVHPNKIRVFRNSERQMVTGVVTNKFTNVPREYLRDIRMQLHFWQTRLERFETELQHSKENPELLLQNSQINALRGKLNYTKNVQTKGNNESHTYEQYMRWFQCLHIRQKYNLLKLSQDYSTRGHALEKILYRHCKIMGITCRPSFTRNANAEEFDGSFTMSNGQTVLVECKWTKSKDKINTEINSFYTKVSRSGYQTIGLFLSMAGWSDESIATLKMNDNKNIVLMNKEEFEFLLKNRRINLENIMQIKKDELSNTTEPFYDVSQLDYKSLQSL